MDLLDRLSVQRHRSLHQPPGRSRYVIISRLLAPLAADPMQSFSRPLFVLSLYLLHKAWIVYHLAVCGGHVIVAPEYMG